MPTSQVNWIYLFTFMLQCIAILYHTNALKMSNSILDPPFHYSLAAGSKRCFISEFGYSTFWEESDRCRSQAHFSANSGSNSPSSICVMYLPSTGKNLKPWNEPQVAI